MVNSKNREVIIKKLVPVAFTIVFLTGSLSLDAVFAQNTPEKPSLEVLQEALIKSENNPASPKLRFEYAELLRKAGKDQQAFKEYLAVTDIDASYYVAYHMIAQHCKDDKILKEATRRLTHLKETKPKELMLRVALSELLEAQGDYYHASRALVDIVYLNVIPEKYRKKVNDRICFLQAKSRDSHAQKQTEKEPDHESTEVDPPIPEERLQKGIAASRLSPENQADDIGNVTVEH